MGKFIYTDENIKSHSLLGDKLNFIELIAQKIIDNNIDGLIAEAGVYKGGSAKLLATIFPDRDFFLFDSFEGMMENDSDLSGGHQKGDFSDNSIEMVQEYLKENTNCRFFKGWFPETASFLTTEKFALVHVDMDYYQSTVSCIDVFWNRIQLGGVMIFDDYEWVACPGVKRALSEFFKDRTDFIPENSGIHSIAYFKKESEQPPLPTG